MTEETVTQELVSTEEQVPKDGEKALQEAEPQALTEEKVQQMIVDATNKAVTEARELGKRELQSAQDRNKAELARAERRTSVAEDSLSAAQTHLQGLDSDAAKEVELATLRAREQGRLSQDQEEGIRQQQEVDGKALQESLHAHLKSLDIDPADSRIDWASDSSNYVQGRARFDESVSKIVKENQLNVQSGLEKRLNDLESKVGRVNVEANSVETTTSTGVVAGSDAEFIKKFGASELPINKANVDRYNKILSES